MNELRKLFFTRKVREGLWVCTCGAEMSSQEEADSHWRSNHSTHDPDE